jgi:hypothetical protein
MNITITEKQLAEMIKQWFEENTSSFNDRNFTARNVVAAELKKQVSNTGHWRNKRKSAGLRSNVSFLKQIKEGIKNGSIRPPNSEVNKSPKNNDSEDAF